MSLRDSSAGFARFESKVASWLIAGLVIGAIAWTLASRGVLSDADTMWHIAVGRWIVTNGAIPTTDPFSFTMAGAPWVAHEWGAALVLYFADLWGNWTGLQLLSALCVAATIAAIGHALSRFAEPLYVFALAFLAMGCMHSHLLARPHLLIWPLLATSLLLLVRAVNDQMSPSWWLVPIAALWTNLHGSFTLLFVLTGALGLEAVVREPTMVRARATAIAWAKVGFAMLLLSLLNPQGWNAWVHALTLPDMQDALQHIDEWKRPTAMELVPLGVMILLSVVAMFRNRVPLHPLRLMLALSLVWLAVNHVRHISVVGICLPILLAPAFTSRTFESDEKATFRAAPMSARTRLAIALSSFAAVVATSSLWRLTPPAAIRPVAALEAARRAGVSGNVFNAYNYGGYLINEGVPVFIDGRADLYGAEFMTMTERLLAVDPSVDRDALFGRYNIRWVMLQRDLPISRALRGDTGWRELFRDSTSIVYARVE